MESKNDENYILEALNSKKKMNFSQVGRKHYAKFKILPQLTVSHFNGEEKVIQALKTN